jgi:hypothetical protein
LARIYPRGIENDLRSLAGLTSESPPWVQEDVLQRVERKMDLLSDLGNGAEAAIGRLTELTHHSEPDVRRAASEALKGIRPR